MKTKKNEAIKGKVIRDIRNLLEHEEEGYYNPQRVGIFGATIILNTK